MEVVFLILWISLAAFTAYLAKDKNRNVAGWFVLGFLFGILALIALALLSKLPEKSS